MDVYWSREGDIKPRVVIWEDGTKYNVDRILDVRQAASLKAGGCGIRYTVRICGRERLFFWKITSGSSRDVPTANIRPSSMAEGGGA